MRKMAIDQTTMARKAHAVIPAAGRGVRFGSEENKIYAPLAGRPVVSWTLRAFAGKVDTVVIVAREDEAGPLDEIARNAGVPNYQIVPGGATRQESVFLGMASLAAMNDNDIVLVHDAARPLVSAALIDRCIQVACEYSSAVAALPVADT